MKQSVATNRKLAWLVLALVVLVSVFGVGGAKMRSLSREASTYYNAEIEPDLALRLAAAQGVVAEGEAALDKDNVALQQAQKAVKALEKANGPKEAFAANAQITQTVGTLYETLRAAAGEPAKGSVLQTQWSEVKSRGEIITHSADDYNALVAQLNGKMSGFPAALIASLTGARAEAFSS